MTTSLLLILVVIHPVQTLLLTIYFLADNIFFKVVFFFGIVRSILQAIALIILHVKFSLLSSVLSYTWKPFLAHDFNEIEGTPIDINVDKSKYII